MTTITSPRDSSPNPNRITSPTGPSRVSTPVPPVRTSFEALSAAESISNVSTPATVTGTPLNQRRNRAALRDYYNLKAKSQGTGSGAVSPGGSTAGTGRRLSTDSQSTVASSNATLTTAGGSSQNTGSILPPQIDDPVFNAETYVQELLQASTLREILRTEGTLVSEIRNLDGERKALVYDNYSKLIKAVGTIGDMQKGMARDKSNKINNILQQHPSYAGGDSKNIGVDAGIDGVRGLEAKLDKLMTVVKEIKGERRRSGQRDEKEKLAPTTQKNVRNQRKSQDLVKWVIEAPARLKKLKDENEPDEAEKQWIYIQTLLDKWKGTEGVEEVRSACLEVMGSDENEDEDGDEDSDNNDEDDHEVEKKKKKSRNPSEGKG